MSKITLNSVTNASSLSVINDNFDKVAQALNGQVLFRSVATSEPNQMYTPLDMNSNRVYNLPAPLSSNEPARLQDVQNAISGAKTANLISFTPYKTLASTNVQAAIQELLDEVGTGGSSSYTPPTYGGGTIADFTMTQSTPNGRIAFSTTNPAGWNTGVGKFVLQYEFVSSGYFAACPSGHVAVVTRCDTSQIATAVFGEGIWMGNLTGLTYMPQYYPAMGVETWANGAMPNGNHVFSAATSPSNKLLQDGVKYRVIVTTSKQPNGNRYIRYELFQQTVEFTGASTSWVLVHDSGDVLDHNTWADLTNDGLVFGNVLGENLTSWSIAFTNVTTTWGPAYGSTATDASTMESVYGKDMKGDLRFLNTGLRIKVNNDGTNGALWTAFQNYKANSATSIAALPNGTSTVSNSIYFNTSTPTSSYRAFTTGVSGNNAVLETFNLGQSDPSLLINIGAGNTVGTFSTAGYTPVGASKAIGQASSVFGSIYNVNGYQAQYFTNNNAFDLESVSTIGTIQTFMSATPTNAQVENVVRPLYCMLSVILGELRNNRKVF